MPLEISNLEATFGKVLENVYQDVNSFNVADPNANHTLDLTGQVINTFKQLGIEPDFSAIINTLRTVGIVTTIVFGILFVWILIKMNRYFSERAAKLKAQLRPPAAAEGPYDARWKEVREHLGSFRDAEWKFAVIEADRMVESILEQAGFIGEDMGEKLKGIDKSQLTSINELWSAHKLRNLIAHDPEYQVQQRDAREAVGNFERALRELGALS